MPSPVLLNRLSNMSSVMPSHFRHYIGLKCVRVTGEGMVRWAALGVTLYASLSARKSCDDSKSYRCA